MRRGEGRRGGGSWEVGKRGALAGEHKHTLAHTHTHVHIYAHIYIKTIIHT